MSIRAGRASVSGNHNAMSQVLRVETNYTRKAILGTILVVPIITWLLSLVVAAFGMLYARNLWCAVVVLTLVAAALVYIKAGAFGRLESAIENCTQYH